MQVVLAVLGSKPHAERWSSDFSEHGTSPSTDVFYHPNQYQLLLFSRIGSGFTEAALTLVCLFICQNGKKALIAIWMSLLIIRAFHQFTMCDVSRMLESDITSSQMRPFKR